MIPPFVYAILASLLLGAFSGWKVTSNHYEAQQLEAERQAQKAYRTAVDRGNEVASRLLTAEEQIRSITKWKGEQIGKVTTGKPCLSAGAVGLLSATGETGAAHPVGNAPQSPGGTAATDADVLDWGITAQEQYRTCAARLNNLVDFLNTR